MERPVTVTLALAHGPGFPDGSPEHRYELRVILDSRGCLDPKAWLADPEPWPTRRTAPGGAVQRGDVQHDPDHGWYVTFVPSGDGGGGGGGGGDPDAPVHHVLHATGPMRPGEYLTITEPDGRDYEYRIVGVG
jgi:hypothetical protein